MEPRVTTADSAEEFAAIAHLREWCHDSRECPICKAYASRDQRGIDQLDATIRLHRETGAERDAARARLALLEPVVDCARTIAGVGTLSSALHEQLLRGLADIDSR